MAPPTPDDIRTFRRSQSLSQRGLAAALGCSKRAIQEWEGARRTPPAYLHLAFEQIAFSKDAA